MTAYSAVFLLKVCDTRPIISMQALIIFSQLLRSSNTLAQLHEGASEEIHTQISKTAEAYHEASLLAPSSSSSAASHARFLRSLVAQDVLRARQADKERLQQQQHQQGAKPSLGSRPGPIASILDDLATKVTRHSGRLQSVLTALDL